MDKVFEIPFSNLVRFSAEVKAENLEAALKKLLPVFKELQLVLLTPESSGITIELQLNDSYTFPMNQQTKAAFSKLGMLMETITAESLCEMQMKQIVKPSVTSDSKKLD